MNNYRAPISDLLFLLKEVFDLERLWDALNNPGGIDVDLALAILKEGANIAEKELAPINRSVDITGAKYEDGKVCVAEEFRRVYQIYCEAGWNGLGGNPEFGGLGLPKTLTAMTSEFTLGSCMSFALAPMATVSAAALINANANEEIKTNYLSDLYEGRCTGSMALTEAQAGSDLGRIASKAIDNNDGSFAIHGEKIFITWGEHNLTENILHLVLARCLDAPEGVNGLSLFLVPKILPQVDGRPGQKNHVVCSSIEHKMGLHASPTCVLHFGGAVGWLIGQKNCGLQCMFAMMNSMRLSVGINAVGVAEASWQNALAYAKERIQGNSKNGETTIFQHADVYRMLMQMRANTEAGRDLYLYIATLLDIENHSNSNDSIRAKNLVAFLTPIAKAFLTDTAFESVVLGQQVLGGYGYTRDFILEQFVRDLRVTQIYEGTNGIQAIDLVNRKTRKCKGELFNILALEIKEFLKTQSNNATQIYFEELKVALEKAERMTSLFLLQKNDAKLDLYAKDYLNICGYLVFAWLWARMAQAAVKEDSTIKKEKLQTAQFFFDYILPQMETHCLRITKATS